MSEVVTGGIAVAGVGAVLAVVALAAAATHVISRTAQGLSEQGKLEMDRLEQELDAPPTHTTTKEARQAFEKAFKEAKAMAVQVPSLKEHAESVARILALRQSPLGAFIGQDQWQQVGQSGLPLASFRTILTQAGKAFTQANARSVAQSIAKVAARQGFPQQRDRREGQDGITLVMADADGRALVASVTAADDGAQIKLDLTGRGDLSCHEVMDKIMGGLAEEGVRLEGVRRRSHYRREGSIPVALTQPAPQPKPTSIPGEQRVSRGQLELERRRQRLIRPGTVNLKQ